MVIIVHVAFKIILRKIVNTDINKSSDGFKSLRKFVIIFFAGMSVGMLMGDNGGKPLIHSGSVLIADNILWYGKVVQSVAHNDRHTQALIEFNRMVREDARVESVIVPIRDGLNLIYVK